LSELFQVQEDELAKLQILIECCDLRPAFAVLATNAKQQGLSSNEMIGGSEDLLPYANLAKKVASSFNPHSEVIRANVLRQGDLVVAILRENKVILMALNTANEYGEGSITTEFLPGTVVAALEEEVIAIERAGKQLAEGTKFYNVLVPRLEQISAQASDISVRLAVERCDYEDRMRAAKEKENRLVQETEDAQVARDIIRRTEMENREAESRDCSYAAEVAYSLNSDVPGGSSSNTRDNPKDMTMDQVLANPQLYGIDVGHGVPHNNVDHAQNSPQNSSRGDMNNIIINNNNNNNTCSSSPTTSTQPPDFTPLNCVPYTEGRNVAESTDISQHCLVVIPESSSDQSPQSRDPILPSLNIEEPAVQSRSELLSRPTLSSGNLRGVGVEDSLTLSPTLPPNEGRPGIFQVSNFTEPIAQVDDAKLAQLVGMDFDPQKSYEALQQFDNDLDRALNSLIT